jgi:hypothetical protein
MMIVMGAALAVLRLLPLVAIDALLDEDDVGEPTYACGFESCCGADCVLAVADRLGAGGFVEGGCGVWIASPRSCGEGGTSISMDVDELLLPRVFLAAVWSGLRS